MSFRPLALQMIKVSSRMWSCERNSRTCPSGSWEDEMSQSRGMTCWAVPLCGDRKYPGSGMSVMTVTGKSGQRGGDAQVDCQIQGEKQIGICRPDPWETQCESQALACPPLCTNGTCLPPLCTRTTQQALVLSSTNTRDHCPTPASRVVDFLRPACGWQLIMQPSSCIKSDT